MLYLQYMQQYGFDLAGQDFRVMGTRELMQELRKQNPAAYDKAIAEARQASASWRARWRAWARS